MSDLGKVAPDSLIAGGPISTKDVNVLAGQGVLKRGTILGKVRFSIATTGTLAGTGNGTCTLVKAGPKVQPGTYTATASAVSTLTTAAVFNVTNPKGAVIGQVVCGLATGDTGAFQSEEISFLITNGSTDFDATSVFTIAATEGVPNTGVIAGTGNGTCVNVRGSRNTKVGDYVATCVEAITGSGKFEVKNPAGDVIGYVYARNYTGTGTGAITQLVAGKNKKQGLYTVICTVAASNGGTFQVKDPDGVVIGTVTLPGTSTGSVVFNSDEISFKIADATDFIVGDVFKLDILDSDEIIFEIVDGSTDFILTDTATIAVTIGEKSCKKHDYANVDGSQFPYAVLAEDIDATSADVAASAYASGQMVERELVYSTADFDAVQRIRDDLRAIGIEVVGSVRRDAV